MSYRPRWLAEGADKLVERVAGPRRPDFDFDVVIVGSGYGGAVAAARFARALRDPTTNQASVCVLERGAEYVPGSFPTGIADLPWHVRLSRPDDPEVKGRADGLYDFRLGTDVSALVGNGLGGGSLINASVAERPQDDVLDEKDWPAALRRDRVELDEMYATAIKMLHAGPADAGKFPKFRALQRFASSISLEATPARLAVHQADRVNDQGVEQKECIGCGDCVTGCNFKAKNTLPMNYLAEAKALGASLYVGATVSHVIKDGKGWKVVWRRTGTQHPPKADPAAPKDRSRDDTYVLRARHVVISAGTFGSTEILLRSREQGLHLSKRLGKRFSANGDMISVHYDGSEPVKAAPEEHSKFRERGVGPTITGKFSSGDTRANRVVVEELAVPGALHRLFREIVTTGALPVQLGRKDTSRHGANDDDPAAVHPGRIERTQVFAAMGNDGAKGELELVDGWRKAGPDGAIRVEWDKAGDAAIYGAEDALLAKSEAGGGMYLRSPLWKPLPESLSRMLSGKKPDGSLLTVHPLGGCPMGEDWKEGVVDDLGRVYDPFDPADLARVHPGLLVLDGSIVPVALGINPLLTITALAERAVRRYIRLQGWELREEEKAPASTQPPDMPERQPEPHGTEVRFSERMKGPLRLDGGAERYETALEVTFAEIADLDSFLRKGPHEVSIKPGCGSLKVCTTPESEREKRRKQAGVGMPEEGLEWKGAPVTGTVHWMERARSCYGTRMLRALWAWLRSRAIADIWQKYREGGGRLVWKTLRESGALLELASNVGEVRLLRYRLTLEAEIKLKNGPTLRQGTVIHGLKTFRYAYGENPWQQLSWLAVSLEPPGERAREAGILEIDLRHLVQRFTSMFQITQQRDQPSAILDVASMALFLLRIVLKIHFWSFRAPEYEKYDGDRARRRMPGPLDRLRFEPHWTAPFMASRPESNQPQELLRLPLSRYRNLAVKPVEGPPVLLVHGFGSGGVQFAHEGLPHNLVRHLADLGHDVWVAELRTSIALASSRDQWSLDDIAREDFPAIADAVKNGTGAEKFDVVAHCIGSAMFCTAVLGDDGKRFYPRVRSATLLQVGPLITLSPGNRFRGYMAAAMRRFMLTDHVDSSIDDRATAFDTILDRLLATYPYPRPEWHRHRLRPPCKPHRHIANCNRSAAVFSRLMQHGKVRDTTLDMLGDMIGHTNLTTFEQTAQYAFAERLTDRDACNLYVTDENVQERFRFPVRFLHGEKNDVFAPETARRSHRLLQELFDNKHPSEVHILDGYGHLDPLIGDEVNEKVFPLISNFLRDGAGAPHAQPPQDIPLHAYPRRALIGPLLGWVRRNEKGERFARIWCRTDDTGCYAYFLLAVVINRASGEMVRGHTFKQVLRDDQGGDIFGELDMLGVIDVPLPQGNADYEIMVVGAHRSSVANSGLEAFEAEARKQVPDHEAKLAFAAPPVGSAIPDNAVRLPDAYGEALLRWRKEHWQSRLDEGERAREAHVDGYFERPDSVLISKDALERLEPTEKLEGIERPRERIELALACCRFSATLIDRERADASFGLLRDLIEPGKGARQLSHLLLIGDQIYSDATAGLFDPKNRRGRFDDSYREAWTAPNARAVLRRLPTYMMMDDHEVGDDWHPEDRESEKMPQTRRWGLIAFEDYQLAHSPRGRRPKDVHQEQRRPKGPYHYEFESGGFHFFVCDTRSEREGRSRIISQEQMAALRQWMLNRRSSDGRPLFIVSPSVVLPQSKSGDADDWSGFSESLKELLGHITTLGVRIVFLCGDSHLAMNTRIRLPGQPEGSWQCLCIASTPLYAPMPFANAKPADAHDAGDIELDDGRSVSYERDRRSIVASDGVTIVGAEKRDKQWWVTVDIYRRREEKQLQLSYKLD
jgi:cholesterol oxidase